MDVASEKSDEECDLDLYNFFVCEEYVEKKWTFGDIEQPLLCSKMCCTDHDLTGQIVWPASILLSWFLYENRSLFSDSSVIELGAGCGLAGYFVSKMAKAVTITDGNDIVLRLLQQNKTFLDQDNVRVCKLLWGVTEDISVLFGDDFPKYIIGADVILWPNQLLPLLYTIKWLLFGYYEKVHSDTNADTGKAFISYVVRANATTELFYKTSKELGLKVAETPRSCFVPNSCSDFVNLESKLFELTLEKSEIEKGCNWRNEKISQLEIQIQQTYLPC